MALLRASCPACDTLLKGVEGLQTATVTARRTCRHCGQRWQLVCRPLSTAREGVRVDVVDLQRLPPLKDRAV